MPAVFVHVSDIHFGQEKDARVYIHGDVKQQLIEDAREVVSQIANGVANGILVTGDIAHSGTWTEYQEAGKWLDQLAESIGVEHHCVQMVPGNHDLDRSKLSTAGRLILNHIREGGAGEYENILNNEADRSLLYGRFEDYGRFSMGYNCPLNNEGFFASDMEVNLTPERKIRFIRFNSALLCHGSERDDNPELIIGARQFAIPISSGVENIVLVHHPLHWYKDQDDVVNYIRNRARVFISGHEHNPKVSVESVDDGCDIMMLSAGATVPYKSDDTYTFTYNIIEFDWDDEIDGLIVTMHPRAWNPQRTCFEADNERLGGKTPQFKLACPFFKKSQLSHSKVTLLPSDIPVPAQNMFDVTPIAENAFHANFSEENQIMQSKVEGYEIARLKFFRDLFEGERLRILIELDVLPRDFQERMSQGLERKLFDKLVQDGKMSEINDMLNRLISERKAEGK